jgi:hypothetical protein
MGKVTVINQESPSNQNVSCGCHVIFCFTNKISLIEVAYFSKFYHHTKFRAPVWYGASGVPMLVLVEFKITKVVRCQMV